MIKAVKILVVIKKVPDTFQKLQKVPDTSHEVSGTFYMCVHILIEIRL